MFLQNMIILACMVASLFISWKTYVQYGGGFALIKLLSCMILLYSGMAIFLGLTLAARISGFLMLIPGLLLFLSI